MSAGATAAVPLDTDVADGLDERLQEALGGRIGRARVGDLICVTLPLARDADPCAIAFASRDRGEALFCLEQPERGGLALAGIGAASLIDAGGAERFRECAAALRSLAQRTITVDLRGRGAEEERAPLAPVALGGFAFSPQGGQTPLWRGFGGASSQVPELLLARLPGGAPTLTVTLPLGAEEGAAQLAGRVRASAARLRRAPLPLLDPSPSERAQVASAMAPEHYEAAVARARELIAEGVFTKIVLAREVQVHAAAAYEPAALFGALRGAFGACFCYCVIRGEATFLGASPELLVRREGARLSTIALAGSSRRSSDPTLDAHLAEQLLRSASHREEHRIVVERIVRDLGEHALWVSAAPEPSLVRVANIQHLATPIRAQLASDRDAIELAGLLHPTPAVGGEPREQAIGAIPALEGLDRGWYAGALGYCDGRGDGEYFVALRCALLRERIAHCFAGNGIVRGSDPAAELAETEIKLQAILPLLAM